MAFRYTTTIEVQTGQVVGGPISNYVALASFTDGRFATEANGGHVKNANGYDLVPTDDGTIGGLLPYEREVYDAATGYFVDWVSNPSLDNGSTIIYAYADAGVTTDQSDPTSVWAPAVYKYVGHLSGAGPSGDDSTSNGLDMTNTLATSTTGKIDHAAAFNGSNAFMDQAGFSMGAGAVAMELWAYSTDFNQNGMMICKEPVNGQWQIFFETGSLKLRGGGVGNEVVAPLPSNSAWHYIVGTISGLGVAHLYVDGIETGISSTVAPFTPSSDTLNFGRYSGFGGGYYYSGKLDEVRISAPGLLGADAVATNYNNQNDQAAFWDLGDEVDGGGGGGGVTVKTLAALGVG